MKKYLIVLITFLFQTIIAQSMDFRLTFPKSSASITKSNKEKLDSFINKLDSLYTALNKKSKDTIFPIRLACYPLNSKSQFEKSRCIGLQRYRNVKNYIKSNHKLPLSFEYIDLKFSYDNKDFSPKLVLAPQLTNCKNPEKQLIVDHRPIEITLTFNEGTKVLKESSAEKFETFLKNVDSLFLALNKQRPVETGNREILITSPNPQQELNKGSCVGLKRYRKIKTYIEENKFFKGTGALSYSYRDKKHSEQLRKSQLKIEVMIVNCNYDDN